MNQGKKYKLSGARNIISHQKQFHAGIFALSMEVMIAVEEVGL